MIPPNVLNDIVTELEATKTRIYNLEQHVRQITDDLMRSTTLKDLITVRLMSHDKIYAIKLYRLLTNSGLREAKDYVDELMRTL